MSELNSELNKAKSWAIFDKIAKRYDLLNHLLSLGIDRGWRSALCKNVSSKGEQKALDLCCGTGDLTFALSKLPTIHQITGIDLSQGMLDIAKLKRLRQKESKKITFIHGDAELPPFEKGSFDLITIAFGIRNLPHPSIALKNYYELLKPDGVLMVLEFSRPNAFFNLFFGPYFKYILPKIGAVISRDRGAYTYLFQTVQEFPQGLKFLTMMVGAGFNTPLMKRLTFGVATLYWATKV